VGLYAGTQNIKAGRGLDTELRDGDVLNVIVAVAGG
jgi:molybdopterin converting factor small subunit